MAALENDGSRTRVDGGGGGSRKGQTSRDLGADEKKQERGAAEQRTKHRSSDIPMLKKCSNDHDFFSESVTNFISFQTSIKSLKTEFEVKKYS
jgi:hypothetical protein